MWQVTVLLALVLGAADGGRRPLEGKKVVFILAHRGFRDEELLVPKRVLEEKGARVVLASSALDTAEGMLGTKVVPDVLVDSVKVDEYDAVVFVGGMGASQYWDDPKAHALVKEALEKGKILCAICIAPVTLANAGALKGRKATSWPSVAGRLRAKGAIYTGAHVQRDGKVVTADGPRSAEAFAREIAEALGRRRGERTPHRPGAPVRGPAGRDR